MHMYYAKVVCSDHSKKKKKNSPWLNLKTIRVTVGYMVQETENPV